MKITEISQLLLLVPTQKSRIAIKATLLAAPAAAALVTFLDPLLPTQSAASTVLIQLCIFLGIMLIGTSFVAIDLLIYIHRKAKENRNTERRESRW
jgi:hypothetical protein